MSKSESVRLRNEDSCRNCKTKFGFFTAKHICRQCAGTFCSKCSKNKINVTSPSGAKIEVDVRLCDFCYTSYTDTILNTSPESKSFEAFTNEEEQLQLAIALSQKDAERSTRLLSNRNFGCPEKYHNNMMTCEEKKPSFSSQSWSDQVKDDLAAIEENELKAAIDLSLREAQSKRNQIASKAVLPSIKRQNSNRSATPSLSMYLNRGYWEQKKAELENLENKKTASVPGFIGNSIIKADNLSFQEHSSFIEDSGIAEPSQYCQAVNEQVDAMDFRMQSNLSRGGSVSNDNGIRSLAARLTKCQGHVLSLITKFESDREYIVGLQSALEYIEECKQLVLGMRTAYKRGLEDYIKQSQQMCRAHMHEQLKLAGQKIQGKNLSQKSPADEKQLSELPVSFPLLGSLFLQSNQLQADTGGTSSLAIRAELSAKEKIFGQNACEQNNLLEQREGENTAQEIAKLERPLISYNLKPNK